MKGVEQTTMTVPALRALKIAALLGASLAGAQQPVPATTTLKGVALRDLGVREAVTRLFRPLRARYPKARFVVDSRLLGRVTLVRSRVALGDALKEIARQLEAEVKVDEDGTVRLKPIFPTRDFTMSNQDAHEEVEQDLAELGRTVGATTGKLPTLDPAFAWTVSEGTTARGEAARKRLVQTFAAYSQWKVERAEITEAPPGSFTADCVVASTATKGGKKTTVRYLDRWRTSTGDHHWRLVLRRPY